MEINDPIKISSFLTDNSSNKYTTFLYTPIENYLENPLKGRLFGIINLNSAKDYNCIQISEAIKALITTLYANSDEVSLIDSLESTIAQAKSELYELVTKEKFEISRAVDFNCLLFTIKDNVCYLASFGDCEVYLVREGREVNLNVHLRDTLGQNQIRVASVIVEKGDIIVTSSPSTLAKVLSVKLKSCIAEFNFEKLNTTPLKSEKEGVGIFALGYDLEVQKKETPRYEIPVPPPKPKPELYPGRKIERRSPQVDTNIPTNSKFEKNSEFVLPESNIHTQSNFQKDTSTHENHQKRIHSEPINFTQKDLNSNDVDPFVASEDHSQKKYGLHSKFQVEQLPVKNIPTQKKRIFGDLFENLKSITIFDFFIKFTFKISNWISLFSKRSVTNLRNYKQKSNEAKLNQKNTKSSYGFSNVHAKPRSNQNLKNNNFNFLKKINVKILIPILVVIIVIIAIFIANSMKVADEKKAKDLINTKANEILTQARNLLNDADLSATNSKPRSKVLLTNLELKLKELEAKNLVEYNAQIDEIRSSAQVIVDKKIEKNIILDESNVISDLSSVYRSPSIVGIEYSGDKIYIAFNDGTLLQSQSSGSKTTAFINVLDTLQKIKIDEISQDSDGNILLYDNTSGMFKYNVTSKSFDRISNLSSTVVGNANFFITTKINNREYLYYLNPTNKQLLRSLKNAENYGNPEVRLKDEEFVNATSISIDGKVWVSIGGKLKKYFDGVEEPVVFNTNSFDFNFSAINNIKATSDRILFSDDGTSRVLIFNKVEALSQSSLNYIASFIFQSKTSSGGFSNILDFEIVGNDIYILDSKKLYKVSYQIPPEYLVGI
jgi:hypothetical protein